VRRGPHDHLGAIIYMSRATPRKTKGTADWLGPLRAGLASGRPLAHRDHGPDGPESVEGPFLGPRAPSRTSGGRSPVSAAGAGSPVGTISAHGPDTGSDRERRAFGGDPRLPQLWFARAFGSTGCGLAAPTFRPVACRARRRGGRRAVVPGRPSKPVFEAVLPHAAGGNATTGIIVGVVSLCFSFSFPFDQQGLPCRSTSRSPVDSAAGR
jgi:hypothetical protein